MANDLIKVSWSSLLRWEECGMKFLKHDQREKSVITDGRNFIQGSICDKVMRQWLSESNPQPGGMFNYIEDALQFYAKENDEYVIKWRGDRNEDFTKVREFCYGAIASLEHVLTEKVLPYEYDPAGRFDVPIKIPSLSGELMEIRLIGEWDLLVRDKNKDYHIMDLKVTANKDYVKGKTLAQLTFYALVVGSMFKDLSQPKTAGFITPALDQTYIPVSITDRDKQILMSRIVKFVHGIQKKEFEPQPGNHCFGCGVKHVCNYWNPPLVSDNKGRNRVSIQELASKRKELRNEP